jgi:cell division protein ZapA (FtsZ GTPase activity inhibitor)
MKDELIPLNVLIADRTYRVKINPKDEEVIRKTSKTINDKLVEFKTAFAGKDMQDYIAMVLLWFATEQNAAISNQVNLDNVSSRLQTLERQIDNALENLDNEPAVQKDF